MKTLQDCHLLRSQNDGICQNIQVSSLWCSSRLVDLHLTSVVPNAFPDARDFQFSIPLLPMSKVRVSRQGYFGKECWGAHICLAAMSVSIIHCQKNGGGMCLTIISERQIMIHVVLALHSHNIQARMFYSLKCPKEDIVVTSLSGPDTR